LRIADLSDPELEAARKNRSHAEFCWTCAPALSDFVIRQSDPGAIVVYVDADLFFYSDPTALAAELGDDKNILIHPHRFSAATRHMESSSGTFNVGFVAFRVSDEARQCTARWRRQVLDLCVKDPERGLCGDQGYLNEWPARYPGLRVMENFGGGVAPWNVDSYAVAGSPSLPLVDGIPVVFYHFHQLKTVSAAPLSFAGVVPATGYDFPENVWRILYSGYLGALRVQSLNLARMGLGPRSADLAYSLPKFLYHAAIREVLPASAIVQALRYLKPLAQRARRVIGSLRPAANPSA
jgi:hypothetical protein